MVCFFCSLFLSFFFFFNDTATTEIYTLSLHDALPILHRTRSDDLARHIGWQVTLSDMQHVGACRDGDVGPVVHREQRAVPVAGCPEDIEEAEFFPRLQALLPELHDVHARPEHLVK